MSLRGSVPEFPLDAVLRFLSSSGKTGVLQVRGDRSSGTVGLNSGRLVAASSAEDVDDGDGALGALFAIPVAEFEFKPGDLLGPQSISGELEEILVRARDERDRVTRIREVVPHDRLIFRLSDRAAARTKIELTSDEWRTLLAVNGTRDVAGVAAALHVRSRVALGLLDALVRAGAVDTDEPPPSQPAPLAGSAGPAITSAPVAPPKAAETTEEWPALTPAPPGATREVWAAMPAPATESWSEPVPAAETWPNSAPEPWSAPAAEPWPAAAPPVAETWPSNEPFTSAPSVPTPDAWSAPASDITGERVARPGERTASREATESYPAASSAWSAPVTVGLPPKAAPHSAASMAADDRLAALSGLFATPSAPARPVEPVIPQGVVAPPVTPQDVVLSPVTELAPPPTQSEAPAVEPAAPPAKKEGGLFGFGRKSEPVAAMVAMPAPTGMAATRAGKLAAFSNALIREYNSGRYGKGRVEGKITNLLLRVDEQADPVDRPIPIDGEALSVSGLDAGLLPEAQAVPYLAFLVTQIHADAERAFGKDKAKQGYQAARRQTLGDDPVLGSADLLGRLPKF